MKTLMIIILTFIVYSHLFGQEISKVIIDENVRSIDNQLGVFLDEKINKNEMYKDKTFSYSVLDRKGNITPLSKYIESIFFQKLPNDSANNNFAEQYITKNINTDSNASRVEMFKNRNKIDYSIKAVYNRPKKKSIKLSMSIMKVDKDGQPIVEENHDLEIELKKQEVIIVEALHLANLLSKFSVKELLEKYKLSPLPMKVTERIENQLHFYKNQLPKLYKKHNLSEKEMRTIVDYCSIILLINSHIKGKLKNVRYITEVQNYFENKLTNSF